jgi:phosphotransferase system HPr-like phosphotransfer protein
LLGISRNIIWNIINKEAIHMKTVQISLNSIDKVKSFVNAITQFDYDFDLISGRYVIDAKSIMGIFSLDLSKPIDLAIHVESDLDEIMEALQPYLVAV